MNIEEMEKRIELMEQSLEGGNEYSLHSEDYNKGFLDAYKEILKEIKKNELFNIKNSIKNS